MWEKFKTVTLCFLIVSSLILTYRLWYGSPEYEAMMPPLYERISFGEAPPLEEFLLPEKIIYLDPLVKEPELVLSPEEDGEEEGEEEYGENNTVYDGDINSQEEELSPQVEGFEIYLLNQGKDIFHSLWEELSREIKDSNSQNLRFSREEGENQPDFKEILNPTLVFYFNLPLSPQVYFPDEESTPSVPPIKKLYLFLEEEESVRGFMETPQGDLYQVEWDLSPHHFLSLGEEIKSAKAPEGSFLEELIEKDQELKENLAAKNKFVPLDPPKASDLIWQREEMDVDQLARAFFVDFSVVRQVKQMDEGVFYTDGSKGLRIDSQGSIEYSAPIDEQEGEALTPGEAFRRGLEYVTVYGGWPHDLDLRIAEFGKVDLEQKEFYRLELAAYHGGVPLSQEFLNMELIFDEQGLVSYHRHLCQVEAADEKGEVISIEKALKGMVEKLPELFARETPRRINNLYLAYNLGPEDLGSSPVEPSWVVEIDGGQKVYLNARTGEPVKEAFSRD